MKQFDRQVALQALALCMAALGMGGLLVMVLLETGVL